MSKSILFIRKNTVFANAFLPGQAYKSALALATAYKGEIDKTADGFFKANFKTPEIAKQFKLDWETGYNANRKPTPAPAPTSAPAQKPSAPKPQTGKGGIKVSKAVKNALAPYTGKGTSANREVAGVLRGMGIVPNGTEWDYWKTIR